MSDIVQTITARLEAEAAGYEATMRSAARTTTQSAAEIEAAGRRVDNTHTTTGRTAQSSARTQTAASKGAAQAAAAAAGVQEKAAAQVTRAQAAAARAQQASQRAQASYISQQARLASVVKKHGADSELAKAASLNLSAAQGRAAQAAKTAQAAEASLTAAQGRLAASMQTTGTAATGMAGKMKALGSLNSTQLASVNTLSSGMLKTGAVFTAASGLSVKAAMDWDTAWTGVKKTVSGTPQQMDDLESSLRGLTKTLPNSHAEIAGIAQAAGQLGIKTPDIAKFTDTMARLATSTDMTAEDGAMSMSRFMNIMDEAPNHVDRLGATLVGLGNNYAATESEIMEMSQRLAGAGKQAGLSSAEVMGLSTSMSAVGLHAEAGGTAMSMVMKKITNATSDGGEKLDAFAKTAGMSSADFVKAWKTDPAKALDALIKGLGNVANTGGNMNSVLADMGIKGIRETDTMIRLAGGAQGVGQAMSDANGFFEKNQALMNESDMFNGTAANRLKIAWNTIKDGAIDAGQAILPAIATLAEGVGNVMKAFSGLPTGVKQGLGVFTLFASGALLAVGAAGKTVVSVNNVKTAMAGLRGVQAATSLSTVGTNATTAATGLGKMSAAAGKASKVGAAMSTIGRTAVPVAAAASAVVALGAALTSVPKTGAEDIANAMLKLNNAGDKNALNGLFTDWATMAGDTSKKVGSLSDAVNAIANPPSGQALNTWADHAFGWTGLAQSDLTQVTDRFSDISDQMGQMVQGGQGKAAAATFKEIAGAFEAQGLGAEKALDYLPGYKTALQQQAQAAGQALDGQDLLNAAYKGTAGAADQAAAGTDKVSGSLDGAKSSADAAVKSLSEVYDAMQKAQNAAVGQVNAEIGYYDTLKQVQEQATKGAKKGIDVTTEAGRANKSALVSMAQATTAYATSTKDASKASERLTNGRQAFMDMAATMGVPAEKAAQLADTLGLIPSKVYTQIDVQGADAGEKIKLLAHQLNTMPKGKTITIEENSPQVIKGLEELGYKVKNIGDGKIRVTASGTEQADKKIDAVAKKQRKAEIKANANVGAAGKALAEVASKVRTATVGTKANTKPANSALDATSNAKRTAVFGTDAVTSTARGQLSSLTGYQGTATIGVQLSGVGAALSAIASVASRAAHAAKVGKKDGGRVSAPAFAGGGRLPATGLGTDQILGVSRRDGTPTAWVDDREWVINRRSSDQFDGTLSAINRGDRMAALASLVRGHADGGRVGELPALASGGRYRWAGAQVTSTARSVSRASAGLARQKAQLRAAEKWEAAAQKRLDAAKSKSAKARARAALKRAKARVKAENADVKKYDKLREDRKDKLQAARERKTRLGELEFTTRRTLYRGTMRDQYGAGNYSGVDALFEQSRNTDLSKSRRKSLSSLAYRQERQVKSLTKQSDKLTASLEKATSKRDDLLSARDNIKSSMLGSLDLTSLTGQKDQWGYSQFAGKAGVLSYVKTKAAGAKKLEGLIQKLNKKKIPAALIQDVINEWTSAGTFELANAILSMNAAEAKSLIASYASVDTWSQRVGDRYTDAMAGGGYKSGLYAAQGVVKGLEKQQKKVESAFARLAKQGEAAFRRALGIRSPSRVMMANAGHIGSGLVMGVRQQIPAAVSAMADLAHAQSQAYQVAVTSPRYSMPASAEVARYAAGQGSSAYVTRDELMTVVTQLTDRPINATLVANGRQLGNMVQQGQRFAANNR